MEPSCNDNVETEAWLPETSEPEESQFLRNSKKAVFVWSSFDPFEQLVQSLSAKEF